MVRYHTSLPVIYYTTLYVDSSTAAAAANATATVRLNQCVGELNHRYFLFFLLANTVFFFYGSYLLFLVLASDVYRLNLLQAVFVDPSTGLQHRATWLMVLNYIAYRNLELVSLFFFALIMGIAVTIFLAYHLYLLVCGVTTNEAYKLDTFRSIHQDMVKAHERYIEDESRRGAAGEIGNSSGDDRNESADDDGEEDESVDNDGEEDEADDADAEEDEADDDDGEEDETADYDGEEDEAADDDGGRVDKSSDGGRVDESDATTVDPSSDAGPSYDPQLSSSVGVDEVSVECLIQSPTANSSSSSSSSVPLPPSCSKPLTVQMHPIRAFCEEHDRMPDLLPTHPGPFPSNIYYIGLWASLR